MGDKKEVFVLPFSKKRIVRRKDESRTDFNQRKAKLRAEDAMREQQRRETSLMESGRIEHPLEKFKRVWEMPSNSGTVNMRPVNGQVREEEALEALHKVPPQEGTS